MYTLRKVRTISLIIILLFHFVISWAGVAKFTCIVFITAKFRTIASFYFFIVLKLFGDELEILVTNRCSRTACARSTR